MPHQYLMFSTPAHLFQITLPSIPHLIVIVYTPLHPLHTSPPPQLLSHHQLHPLFQTHIQQLYPPYIHQLSIHITIQLTLLLLNQDLITPQLHHTAFPQHHVLTMLILMHQLPQLVILIMHQEPIHHNTNKDFHKTNIL